MKAITLNERAMAAAIDFVAPGDRQLIERVYELVNNAEIAAFAEGFDAATKITETADYIRGWTEGYGQGIAVATSVEQPEFYEGDSGDEDDCDICGSVHFDDAVARQMGVNLDGSPRRETNEAPPYNQLPPMQEQRDAVNRIPGETQFRRDQWDAWGIDCNKRD